MKFFEGLFKKGSKKEDTSAEKLERKVEIAIPATFRVEGENFKNPEEVLTFIGEKGGYINQSGIVLLESIDLSEARGPHEVVLTTPEHLGVKGKDSVYPGTERPTGIFTCSVQDLIEVAEKQGFIPVPPALGVRFATHLMATNNFPEDSSPDCVVISYPGIKPSEKELGKEKEKKYKGILSQGSSLIDYYPADPSAFLISKHKGKIKLSGHPLDEKFSMETKILLMKKPNAESSP